MYELNIFLSSEKKKQTKQEIFFCTFFISISTKTNHFHSSRSKLAEEFYIKMYTKLGKNVFAH